MKATKEQVKWAHEALGCDLAKVNLLGIGKVWECDTHATSVNEHDDYYEGNEYQHKKRCYVAWNLAQRLADREANA